MFAITFAAVSQASSARFERLVDVLPADHDQRVDPVVAEERGDRVVDDPVAFVLEPLQLDERSAGSRAAPSGRVRAIESCSTAWTRMLHCSTACFVVDSIAVELEQVGDLLDVVDDVVELGRELRRCPRGRTASGTACSGA